MWRQGWREDLWEALPGRTWDMIVVGGGITGAGVLREATRAGLRALLLEGGDFASGTSSRSSKYVHGGLRYLRQGKVGIARESVRERERLLREAPGLVEPLGFLLPVYAGKRANRWVYPAFLTLYNALAGRGHAKHTYHGAADFQLLAPHLDRNGLRGGFRYGDAQTDDARLVLRLLREAVAAGGRALNYAPIDSLLLANDAVAGVRVRDAESGREAELPAPVVVNATGVRADRLRGEVGAEPILRPLRGSHLVFPAHRLPVAQAVAFPHPGDARMVSVAPWEGATVVGTTDLDHSAPLDGEPRIDPAEAAYLMAAVTTGFPALELNLNDVVATWAGVRPVVGGGSADPSRESREHLIACEQGLITATGGKLTTFRPMARAVLAQARRDLPHRRLPADSGPVFDRVDGAGLDHPGLDASRRRRLAGHLGREAGALIAAARSGELEAVAGTRVVWAQLRWAAREEGVVHLDDLLLRRVRLGLLLPAGGAALLPAIRDLCRTELGWSAARWQVEEAAYLASWNAAHRVPTASEVGDRPASAGRGG